jgi:hypothetical protein
MISHRNYFKMAFPELPQPVSDFWRCLINNLDSVNALPKHFTLSEIAGHPEHLQPGKGKPDLVLKPGEIEAIIAERSLTGFSVNTGYSERSVDFCLTRYPKIGWASFNCRIAQKAKAPQDWSSLIETMFSCWQSIGAWQFYLPYQAWQWEMEKHNFYEMLCGPFPPGFRTFPDPDYDGISDRRTFIDISLNPGRPMPLRPEIKWCPVNFYPTAEMWLGPHFWQYAKCTKEEALAGDFWLRTRDTPHFTYFKCWPEAFTRPDGEQGRMQQRLWKLFFHEDCEWPPGSGTICDDPMYGPPELKPGQQSSRDT